MSVVCSYARQFPLHKYRFELAFAPVVEFVADNPLTLDEWVTRWLQPLVDVASLASGDPQRLAWLTVHSGTGREETSGVVFGGGIAQAPYRAGYDDEWTQRAPAAFHLRHVAGSVAGPLAQVEEAWQR